MGDGIVPALSVITPQFELMPGPGGRRLKYADTVGTGWAGSMFVVQGDGDPVTFVSGQWTVPDVVPPRAITG